MIRAVVAALAIGGASPLFAQTFITPDTTPAATTGTIAARQGSLTVIDGGRRVGNNLFHSFSTFALLTGQTALWARAANDGATIANIVNRVTGGIPSFIDGTLETTGMPNASFWFLNPAGIVFGANASVAVPNAAHFSTAGVLGFADGGTFAATTPGGSTFSVAAPSAFGFLGNQGNITVTNAAFGRFVLSPATRLTLTGQNIGLFNTFFQAGGLDLVAVGNQVVSIAVDQPLSSSIGNGQIVVSGSEISAIPGVQHSGLVRLSAARTDIVLSNVYSASTNRAGAGLQARSGTLFVDRSYLGSFGIGTAATGAVTVDANVVDVSGGSLASSATGTGPGGAVVVNADSVVARNAGFIGSRVLPGGRGAGGSVTINARSVNAIGGLIQATSAGAGTAGDLSITAQSVLVDGGVLGTVTFAEGNAGKLSISAGTIRVTRGGSISSEATGTATGNAGDMRLTTPQLTVELGGRIQSVASGRSATGSITIDGGTTGTVSVGSGGAIESSTFGSGDAGVISIRTGTLAVQDARIASEAEVGSTGNAGAIAIVADRVAILGGGEIAASTFGSGDAGFIDITTRQMVMVGGRIASEAEIGSTGGAGAVLVSASERLTMTNSVITSSTNGSGSAGLVSIETSDLSLLGSVISSDVATTGTGDAGGVVIDASTIMLDQSLISSGGDNQGNGGDMVINTGSLHARNGSAIVSTVLGSGNAGNVAVTGDTILIEGGSRIESDAAGSDSGDAGTVTIEAKSLTLRSGGEISTLAAGTGIGGLITIKADTVDVDGGAIGSSTLAGGEGGAVVIMSGSLRVANGGTIASEAEGVGHAGAIDITTRTLTLASNGVISTGTFAFGNAGDISIKANDIRIESTGRILSSQLTGAARGNAGRIAIETGSLYAGPADRAAISTNIFNAGDAGDIAIVARTITLDGAEIGSSANGTAESRSGTIDIAADTLNLINGGRIETSSFSPEAAGDISIVVDTLRLEGTGSALTSENLSARGGSAGSIDITARRIDLIEGGGISTDSTNGPAGNISITMPRDGNLILRGRTNQSFITTSSGPGTGGVITIVSPYLILSDGGSILALGEAAGADVVIQSNFFIRSADRFNTVSVDGGLIVDSEVGDLSTGAEAIDLSFLDASSVLRGQCSAARAGGANQFNATPVGPYVPLAVRPVDAQVTAALKPRLRPCG